jgi:leukotriene-A4 hydrolase
MPASTTTTSPRILQDRSSLSAPHEVIVKHLDWEIAVDFDNSRLTGRATYTIERLQPEATQLKLDTSHLFIEKVTGPKDDVPLKFEQHKSTKSYLGSQLVVFLDKDSSVNQVTIHYQTTKESSALQWLPPAQTVGRIHPYLFTQCQAIHARSLVPCQDRPGVKMTYSAKVTVPSWAVCVMSAVLKQETTLSEEEKCYEWHQAIPISSYLLAMAVGDLERRDISDRCAVWSEPGLADAALYEFGQTEDFLKIAEELAGKPYVWGRYDLLCLPPSFPYGGMENPCLTFVTPTLLAGDRSLAGTLLVVV